MNVWKERPERWVLKNWSISFLETSFGRVPPKEIQFLFVSHFQSFIANGHLKQKWSIVSTSSWLKGRTGFELIPFLSEFPPYMQSIWGNFPQEQLPFWWMFEFQIQLQFQLEVFPESIIHPHHWLRSEMTLFFTRPILWIINWVLARSLTKGGI